MNGLTSGFQSQLKPEGSAGPSVLTAQLAAWLALTSCVPFTATTELVHSGVRSPFLLSPVLHISDLHMMHLPSTLSFCWWAAGMVVTAELGASFHTACGLYSMETALHAAPMSATSSGSSGDALPCTSMWWICGAYAALAAPEPLAPSRPPLPGD